MRVRNKTTSIILPIGNRGQFCWSFNVLMGKKVHYGTYVFWEKIPEDATVAAIIDHYYVNNHSVTQKKSLKHTQID